LLLYAILLYQVNWQIEIKIDIQAKIEILLTPGKIDILIGNSKKSRVLLLRAKYLSFNRAISIF
jgi:hypothetical protein